MLNTVNLNVELEPLAQAKLFDIAKTYTSASKHGDHYAVVVRHPGSHKFIAGIYDTELSEFIANPMTTNNYASALGYQRMIAKHNGPEGECSMGWDDRVLWHPLPEHGCYVGYNKDMDIVYHTPMYRDDSFSPEEAAEIDVDDLIEDPNDELKNDIQEWLEDLAIDKMDQIR